MLQDMFKVGRNRKNMQSGYTGESGEPLQLLGTRICDYHTTCNPQNVRLDPEASCVPL